MKSMPRPVERERGAISALSRCACLQRSACEWAIRQSCAAARAEEKAQKILIATMGAGPAFRLPEGSLKLFWQLRAGLLARPGRAR